MMGVLTQPRGKTSTCCTVPSFVLIWPRSHAWTSWDWRSWRSGSNPVRQAWCVGWSIRTTGVIGVAVKGVARDTVIRRLVHVPFGWRPTTLLVSVRRYRCGGCGHVWRQDTSRAAEPRSKLSRATSRGRCGAHLVMARIAEALAVSWNTANDAVLAGTGPARLLDMVEGRSKAAFKAWLAPRPKAWRDGVKVVVAMDRFTGFKTAASEKLRPQRR